jgi:hypothetical protein
MPLRSLVAATVTLLACSGGEKAPRVPSSPVQRASQVNAHTVEPARDSLGSASQAALDRGNMLFRKKAYRAALKQYHEASALAPQDATPLFGVYMVARAINDAAMADSAVAGIRARNGFLPPATHGFTDTALKRVHGNFGKGAE